MSKIEFETSHIDVSKKKADQSRDVIINVGEYMIPNIVPIMILKEGNFKVTIEDQ